MRSSTIDQKGLAAPEISDSLESVTFHSIRNVVSDALVEQTCQEVGYHFGRRVKSSHPDS